MVKPYSAWHKYVTKHKFITLKWLQEASFSSLCNIPPFEWLSSRQMENKGFVFLVLKQLFTVPKELKKLLLFKKFLVYLVIFGMLKSSYHTSFCVGCSDKQRFRNLEDCCWKLYWPGGFISFVRCVCSIFSSVCSAEQYRELDPVLPYPIIKAGFGVISHCDLIQSP